AAPARRPRGAAYPRRRGGQRLPGGVPGRRHRVRRPERQAEPRPQAARVEPALRRAVRVGHPASRRLPGGTAQPEPRSGGGVMASETPPVKEAKEGEIIAPGHTFGTITDKIGSIVQGEGVSYQWLAGLAFSFMLVNVLMLSIAYLLLRGTGIWGV